MKRVLFFYVLPLLVPITLYLIWAWVERRRGKAGGKPDRWLWPVAAGFVLMFAVLVYTALTGGGEAGKTYQPPHMVDGAIVPGQFTDSPR